MNAPETIPHEADLDVTPLSVGFDLRVQGVAVELRPDMASARYDLDGSTRYVEGTTGEVAAALTAAGYTVRQATTPSTPDAEALCAELAGAHESGNLGDLGDCIACAIENAESAPEDRCAGGHTLDDAREAIARARDLLSRAEHHIATLAAREVQAQQ